MPVVEQEASPRAATPSDSALLSVRGLCVRFGGITALDGVSFDVRRGQIAGLIGPNGAGKTTLFNCLSRLYGYAEGNITFAGQPMENVPRHRVARSPRIGSAATSRCRDRSGRSEGRKCLLHDVPRHLPGQG